MNSQGRAKALIPKALAPVLSGCIIALAFPKHSLYWMAWVGMVPVLLSITNSHLSNKSSFGRGFLFGMVYFSVTLYWIYHPIHYYGNTNLFLSIGSVLILSAYLSLYTGIFTLLINQIYKKTFYPLSIVAPSLWISLEYLRTYLFTGFPWAIIGYSQFSFLSLIQIADITGVYGVSFLIVAFNGAIVDLILLRKRTENMPFYPLAPGVAAIFFLVIAITASFIYSHSRLSENRHRDSSSSVKVSVVQASIPQDRKWDLAFQEEVIKIYKDLTEKAVKIDSPDLVIWPETAVPFIFYPEKPLQPDMAFSLELISFVKRLRTYLLFGSIRQTGAGLYNSAFLLNSDGKITYIYDKIHLVPFGEYVPLRPLLSFVEKITVGIGDYLPGRDTQLAITPFGKFSTLICYEIIFPGLVRNSLKSGADFIVNITNDAWFGKTWGPYQHFSMAVFRAIENRKPVIRAANTGISGFIDSNGRILAKTPLFERMTISMDIKTNRTRTFYSRYGDLFVFFCLLISIISISKITKI